MNRIILCGRLTRDPEIRYSQTANGSMAVARYALAVDRDFKKEGEQTADFINCIAFGKNGTNENRPFRPEPGAAGDGFMSIPDGIEDEGLPF